MIRSRLAAAALAVAAALTLTAAPAAGTGPGQSNHCPPGTYQVRFEQPGSKLGFTVTAESPTRWAWTYGGDWSIDSVWVFAGGKLAEAPSTPGPLDTGELGLTNHRGKPQAISHVDLCKIQPPPPTTVPPTTVPPETTTTAPPPETTTTTIETPTTTLPPPDTPTIVVVDVTYRQECPTPEHPAGLLEIILTGTTGTVVDVMGQTVPVPGTATFDLPAQGYVWTVYVDWPGGAATLTDQAPVCPVDPVPGDDPLPDPVSRPTLPETGATTDRLALVGVMLTTAGAVLFAVRRRAET